MIINKKTKKYSIFYIISVLFLTLVMHFSYINNLQKFDPENAKKDIQDRINYLDVETQKISNLFEKDSLRYYKNDSLYYIIFKEDTPYLWNNHALINTTKSIYNKDIEHYDYRFFNYTDTLMYHQYIKNDKYRVTIFQKMATTQGQILSYDQVDLRIIKEYPFEVKFSNNSSSFELTTSDGYKLYLDFSQFKYKPSVLVSSIFHLILISLIIIVSKILKDAYRYANRFVVWYCYFAVMIYLMYWIFKNGIPFYHINNTHSFNTIVYSLKEKSLTIGQLVYISILNFCITLSYFNNISNYRAKLLIEKVAKIICQFILLAIYFFITFPVIVYSIKENQQLYSYYNFSKVTAYSLLALGNVILNVLTIIVLSYTITSPKRFLKGSIGTIITIIIHIIFTFYFINSFEELNESYYQYAFFTLTYFIFIAYTLPNLIKSSAGSHNYKFKFTTIKGFTWCLIICVWITNLIFVSNYQREKLLRKEIAKSLNIEKDFVAEFKLQNKIDQLFNDSNFISIDTVVFNERVRTYSGQYFDNLTFRSVKIYCNNDLPNDYRFIQDTDDILDEKKSILDSKIDINNSQYLIQYSRLFDGKPIHIIFKFIIPEYYVNVKLSKYNDFSNYSLFYSVAIYFKNHLRTISGVDENVYQFEENLNNEGFVESLNYSFYTQKNADDQIVIIKYSRFIIIQFLSSLSYCLVALIVLCFVILMINNPKKIVLKIDFKEKINIGIISIVSLTFILLSIISITFLKSEFSKQDFRRIKNEKARYQSYINNIINQYKSGYTPQDMTLDVMTSHFPFNNLQTEKSNFRLYSTKGINYEDGTFRVLNPLIMEAFKNHFLVASNDRDGLSPFQMSGFYNDDNFVYHYLKINENVQGIFQFKIPDYDYEKVYSINNIITILINIYVLLFILSITVTLILVNSLTKGIQKLIGQIRNFTLTRNAPIKYDNNDEISLLVKEYNNLLKNVEIMAANLANSERESAWREAAKQVAHEINNPITPIKLNIQYLIKEVENKKDITELFLRVSKSIIHEIDKLSNIAASFSNYGTMPDPVLEKIDIIQHIRSVCTILYVDLSIKLIFDMPDEPIYVNADSKFLNIAFMNLIKNAFQSLNNRPNPQLKISIAQNNNKVKISIQDNGQGMNSETLNKIFVPNFTTKSSGKGIGLSTTKSMITSMNGYIFVTSQEGIGTTFTVTLPTID